MKEIPQSCPQIDEAIEIIDYVISELNCIIEDGYDMRRTLENCVMKLEMVATDKNSILEQVRTINTQLRFSANSAEENLKEMEEIVEKHRTEINKENGNFHILV